MGSVLTSSPTVAEFLQNQSLYDELGAPVTVTDTGLNVGAAFGALADDPVVISIELTDPGIPIIPVSLAQFNAAGDEYSKVLNSLFGFAFGTGFVTEYYAHEVGLGGASLNLNVSFGSVMVLENTPLDIAGNSLSIYEDGNNSPLFVTGGGNFISGFVSETGQLNQVSLAATNGNWDLVSGFDIQLALTDAQASLFGGGLTVTMSGADDALSIYQTNGDGDTIFASDATIILNGSKVTTPLWPLLPNVDGSQVSLIGGANTVFLDGSPNNVLSIFFTDGAWDVVYGSNATVDLIHGQASLLGSNDAVYLCDPSSEVSLYNTDGAKDTVHGDDTTLILNNAQACLVGGANTAYLDGSPDDALGIYQTFGDWDTVYGDNGQITLDDSQASIVGGANSLTLTGSTDDAVSLYNTAFAYDTVSGSRGDIVLNEAQAYIAGGGNTVYLGGSQNDRASISGTGNLADAIVGSNGLISVVGSSANVYGSNDFVSFGGDDQLAASGDNDIFKLVPTGHTTISGFNSTDTIAIPYEYLVPPFAQLHIVASGADTDITAGIFSGAPIYVTMTNIAPSSVKFIYYM
jgi:hypothetical protein